MSPKGKKDAAEAKSEALGGIPEASPAPVVPRGKDPRTGLWPNAMLMQTFLQEPIVDDMRADDLVNLVASLEWRKSKAKEFSDLVRARCDEALDKISSTPAYQSLFEYVKASCRGKTLKLPSGAISIRKSPVKAVVYDEALLEKVMPDAFYMHQPPPVKKISKDWLKKHLQGTSDGKVFFCLEGGEKICVAELIVDEESMTVKPAEDIQNPDFPRVLEGEENDVHR